MRIEGRHLAVWGFCLAAAALFGCSGAKGGERRQISVFSWEEAYMLPVAEERVAEALERLDCNAVFQYVPSDADEAVTAGFIKRRSASGQQVYALAGEPEWGIEPGAARMLAKVEQIRVWNENAGDGGRFAGIVWDVEPYLLDEWDDDGAVQVLSTLADNCDLAYRHARDSGLDVIVCIPNFYDRPELSGHLARLVKDGCDAIAVMNYDKTDEAGQIAGEMELARSCKKRIIHITELQKPGFHGLKEKNTYYYDGIDAVRASWERLEEIFPYEGLGFSWHYLKPALELLEGEPDE